MLRLFKKILSLSDEYKNRIKIATVLSFIESILSKLPIVFSFIVFQKFYYGEMTSKDCLNVGVILVLTVLLQIIIHYLSDYLQSGAGYMIFSKKRLDLGNHLRKLPMGYFTEGNIGKISSVLSTDMIFIEEVAMSTIASMMSNMFSAVILNIFMFSIDKWIGIAALSISILAVIIANYMNKASLREAKIKQSQSEKLTDAVLAFSEGISVIKSYNLIGEKSKEITDNFRDSMNTSIDFERKMTVWTSGLNLIYAIGISIIIAISIVMFSKEQLELPYLIGMILFVFDIFGPIKALYGEATRFTVMDAALDRIQQVFNEKELNDKGNMAIPTNNIYKPEIEFDKVSFSYGDKEVLRNIDFKVDTNTMVALVGPSGGGKSTIANLLSRFWDTNQGSIKIRGVDIRNIPLPELMNNISMVFQRVYLFKDTIYNNILMGNQSASEKEVIEAAKKARCYDFIMNLPDKFNTLVGEGGQTLSGGEKQRISIARCILKDSPIVILDEATASVDVDNESYIQEAILELVKGKTLLVIAHRLHTIRQADQILVIKDGIICERGTDTELLKASGVYYDFVNRIEKFNSLKI